MIRWHLCFLAHLLAAKTFCMSFKLLNALKSWLPRTEMACPWETQLSNLLSGGGNQYTGRRNKRKSWYELGKGSLFEEKNKLIYLYSGNSFGRDKVFDNLRGTVIIFLYRMFIWKETRWPSRREKLGIVSGKLLSVRKHLRNNIY